MNIGQYIGSFMFRAGQLVPGIDVAHARLLVIKLNILGPREKGDEVGASMVCE